MANMTSTRSGLWLCVLGAGCVSEPTELSVDVAQRSAIAIHGRGEITGVTDCGLVHAPMDLSTTDFATFTDVDGELVRMDGRGSADGTFEVQAPRGAHDWELLVQNDLGPVLAVGDARHPTLDRTVLGRLDGVFATAETDVTFDVSGLEPWLPGSTTELTVGNNGGVIFSPEGAGPIAGATTLTSSFDWATAQVTSPLVDAAKGDRVVMTQLTLRTAGDESYQALATAGSPAAGYSQSDGVASTLSIAMAPVPQKTLPLRWRGDRFLALTPEVGAGAVALPDGGGAFLDTLPDADRFGFYGLAAPDLAVYFPSDATSDVHVELSYGNPFRSHSGTSWDEFVTTSFSWLVPVQLGSAAPTNVFAIYQSNRSLRQLHGVAEPRLSPPRDIRFTGDELRWDRSAFGHPNQYFVSIRALSVGADGKTRATNVLTAWTKERSLRIPEDLVPSGTSFVAVVEAVDFGDVDRTRNLGGDSLPVELVGAVSSTFTR